MIYTKENEAGSQYEIVDGCPITRCVGDLRFKNHPNLKANEQPIIPIPEVKGIAYWEQNDLIILGSSGWWEMCRNKNINTMNKLNREMSKKEMAAENMFNHKN